MAINYLKLTDDLIKAKNACMESAKGEDGGSANLDTLYLSIPRAREEKVIEAIKHAGLHGKKTAYYGTKYFIYPVGVGQGNSRYRGVQAMKRIMASEGWDVNVFYKTD